MSTPEIEVVEQVAAEPAAEPPKRADGVQKRINELTRARYEQQRRAEAAEARIAEYEKKQQSTPPPTEDRKTLADFNFDDVAYEDYLAERVTKRAETTAAKKAVEAVEEREHKKAQETTAAERRERWQKASKSFAESHPDFDEVVYADGVAFTDAVAEAIADSKYGPQLAYHLAQNLEELSRITRLSPVAVGRELGELSAEFKAEPKQAEENASAEAPPATKAPPPPPKLHTAGASSTRPSTTSSASDKLSDDEWFKSENQRLASLRKK